MSLIGECHLDRLARGLPNLTRQFSNLRAFLFVGRLNMHSEQLPQSINRHVDLAAAFAFVPVVTGTRLTFAGRLQRAPIQNDRAGLALSALRDPDDRTQVVHHGLEATRLNPALRLLVNKFPRRKIIWQQTPRRTRAYDSAQRIEHLAQFVAVLRCALVHQAQVRSGEIPLFIQYIRWVWPAFFHPARIPGPAKSA